MPTRFILRRRPDDEPSRCLSPVDRALASLRPWIHSEDQADDAHEFVTIAAGRAFPKDPELHQFKVVMSYGYCPESIADVVDPNDGGCGEGALWYRGKRYSGPALLIACDTHEYIDLEPIATRLRSLDPDAASWFIHSLARLPWWVYGPDSWLGHVQMSFWHGEGDETEAIEGCKPDPYEGPRQADVRKALPRWVWNAIEAKDKLYTYRKHRRRRLPAPPDEPVRNLRMSARLLDLGVDMRGLLAADGSYLAEDRRLALNVPADTIDFPVRFGWKRNDYFEQALDDLLQMASQAGMGTRYFAWLPAGDPARCAENYEAVTAPLLHGLDVLCASLVRLSKKRSPLLVDNLTADAQEN